MTGVIRGLERWYRWRRCGAAAALALLAGGSACAGGRAPAPRSGLEAPEVVVVSEAGATAVALALVVAGSGWEDGRTSGVTLLAARSLLEEVGPELEALGATAGVTCGRWAFVFTLVAPEETWSSAAVALTRVLSRPEPSAAAVERARSSLSASLLLDRASPAWQARLAAGRALYASEGGETAWARPPCGVVETLSLFDARAIQRAAAGFIPVRTAAVVGAVEGAPDSVAPWLFADAAAAGRGVRGVAAPFPTPGPSAPGRVYAERNTITAWVSVAWPFGPDADPEAVRVVGALLEDAVGPDLSRPGVLHVSKEVRLHGDGGALVVTAVVAPERAGSVASALESVAAAVAREGAHPAVLERVVRRHRGDRLRELATPEARATRVALALAAGRTVAMWPDEGSFTAAGVRAAARALGAPARAVVGPRSARGAVVP